MPFSDTDGKVWALERISALRPDYVVDVGVGVGTYSDLVRPLYRGEHWTGVEAWGPYINKYGLWAKYDNIIVADVRYLDWDTIGRADLVIFGDILEHMTSNSARRVVQSASRITNNILVSVPLLHLEQAAYEGNPFEEHIDHWTSDAMVSFLQTLGQVVDRYDGEILGAYLLEVRP